VNKGSTSVILVKSHWHRDNPAYGSLPLAVIVAAVHLFQFFDVHFLIRDILEIHGDLAERMEEDKKIDRDDQFRSS
jgi:hypothetical protein